MPIGLRQVALVACVIGIQASSLGVATAAPTGGLPEESKNWQSLKVGECIAVLPPLGDSNGQLISTVSCDTEHAAEVVALTSTLSFAGDTRTLEQKCADGFRDYVGISSEDSAYTFSWISSKSSVSAGFTVVCLAHQADESPFVGSVKMNQ